MLERLGKILFQTPPGGPQALRNVASKGLFYGCPTASSGEEEANAGSSGSSCSKDCWCQERSCHLCAVKFDSDNSLEVAAAQNVNSDYHEGSSIQGCSFKFFESSSIQGSLEGWNIGLNKWVKDSPDHWFRVRESSSRLYDVDDSSQSDWQVVASEEPWVQVEGYDLSKRTCLDQLADELDDAWLCLKESPLT